MLPSLIDYLLTIRRPSGGWMTYQGAVQLVIPNFPPQTTLSYTVVPLAGTYAQIAWSLRFGNDMVPDAFSGYIQQGGSKAYTGLITQRLIDYGSNVMAVVTNAEPTLAYLTNTTALVQRYETIGQFLVVNTEQDLATLLDALLHWGSTLKSEELTIQTNLLLRQLVDKR